MAGFCAATTGSTASRSVTSTTRSGRSPSSTPRSDLGLGLVWLPARAPGGRAPGHPDHDPFWARLAERGVPFVLHVGSGRLPIGGDWMNDGRPAGRAVQRRRDHRLEGLHGRVPHRVSGSCRCSCSTACSSVIRTCAAAAIEMGAGWVPDMLRRLDHAVAIWSRSEPRWRRSNARRPSRPRAAALHAVSVRGRRPASRPSPTRACTCSRPTTRTPRAGAIRSAASSARGPARRRRRSGRPLLRRQRGRLARRRATGLDSRATQEDR